MLGGVVLHLAVGGLKRRQLSEAGLNGADLRKEREVAPKATGAIPAKKGYFSEPGALSGSGRHLSPTEWKNGKNAESKKRNNGKSRNRKAHLGDEADVGDAHGVAHAVPAGGGLALRRRLESLWQKAHRLQPGEILCKQHLAEGTIMRGAICDIIICVD